MAVELWSYIVDPGDRTIKMAHVFYGKTEAEAQKYYDEHLSHCAYMHGAADDEGEGELIDEVVEVADLPDPENFRDDDEEDDSEEEDETEEEVDEDG